MNLNLSLLSSVLLLLLSLSINACSYSAPASVVEAQAIQALEEDARNLAAEGKYKRAIAIQQEAVTRTQANTEYPPSASMLEFGKLALGKYYLGDKQYAKAEQILAPMVKRCTNAWCSAMEPLVRVYVETKNWKNVVPLCIWYIKTSQKQRLVRTWGPHMWWYHLQVLKAFYHLNHHNKARELGVNLIPAIKGGQFAQSAPEYLPEILFILGHSSAKLGKTSDADLFYLHARKATNMLMAPELEHLRKDVVMARKYQKRRGNKSESDRLAQILKAFGNADAGEKKMLEAIELAQFYISISEKSIREHRRLFGDKSPHQKVMLEKVIAEYERLVRMLRETGRYEQARSKEKRLNKYKSELAEL